MRVVIIGDFKSGIGVSIDCRLIYKAFLKNYHLSEDMVHKIDTNFTEDECLTEYTSFKFKESDCVIFCMPLFDAWKVFLKGGLPANALSILIFQWELKNIDKSVISITSIFDKAFTISDFVASGMRKYDKAISSIYLPFDTEKYKLRHRRRKTDNVLMYCTIDWNSFISRKNPDILINAFKKFKCSFSDAFLTIKFNNVTDEQLFQRYGDVSAYGIDLITKRLSHEEYMQFILNQNILVSAHRTEGFGRVIGEAIMHGHIIVSTNYGGCVDYLNDDNSILVNGRLISVKNDEYFSPGGSKWMDVSEKSLIKAMTVAYKKEKFGNVDIKKNMESFAKLYSLDSFYYDLMEKINAI